MKDKKLEYIRLAIKEALERRARLIETKRNNAADLEGQDTSLLNRSSEQVVNDTIKFETRGIYETNNVFLFRGIFNGCKGKDNRCSVVEPYGPIKVAYYQNLESPCIIYVIDANDMELFESDKTIISCPVSKEGLIKDYEYDIMHIDFIKDMLRNGQEKAIENIKNKARLR